MKLVEKMEIPSLAILAGEGLMNRLMKLYEPAYLWGGCRWRFLNLAIDQFHREDNPDMPMSFYAFVGWQKEVNVYRIFGKVAFYFDGAIRTFAVDGGKQDPETTKVSWQQGVDHLVAALNAAMADYEEQSGHLVLQ